MSPTTITVLSTPTCQRCKLVDRYLTDHGDGSHDYIDVTDPANSEWRDWLESEGIKEVPVTLLHDERVIGFNPDALARLF